MTRSQKQIACDENEALQEWKPFYLAVLKATGDVKQASDALKFALRMEKEMNEPWMKIPLSQLIQLLCVHCQSNLSVSINFKQPLELCEVCKQKTIEWSEKNAGNKSETRSDFETSSSHDDSTDS